MPRIVGTLWAPATRMKEMTPRRVLGPIAGPPATRCSSTCAWRSSTCTSAIRPGVVHVAWYEYPTMTDGSRTTSSRRVRREAGERLDRPVLAASAAPASARSTPRQTLEAAGLHRRGARAPRLRGRPRRALSAWTPQRLALRRPAVGADVARDARLLQRLGCGRRTASGRTRCRARRLRRSSPTRLSVVRRHRPGEQVALQLVAAAGEQHVALALGLDALGHHLQAQRVRQLDRRRRRPRARRRCCSRSATKLRSIFSCSRRQLAQVGQARIAGAEVVDRQRARRARASCANARMRGLRCLPSPPTR